MGRVTDPVCGMRFPRECAVAQSMWLERTYYFCHPVCQRIFDADPSRFVGDERDRNPTFSKSRVSEGKRISKASKMGAC